MGAMVAIIVIQAVVERTSFWPLCFSHMQIRPATPADVPAVLPMVEKVSAQHEEWDAAKYPFLPDIPGMYDEWLRRLAVNRRAVFLVAEASGGKIAGFVVGTVEKEIPI